MRPSDATRTETCRGFVARPTDALTSKFTIPGEGTYVIKEVQANAELYANLYDRIEAGHLPVMQIDFLGFPDKRNKNLFRAKREDFPLIAETAIGKPLACNHWDYHPDDHAGLIVACRSEEVPDADGTPILWVTPTVNIVVPKVQLGVLRGIYTRFSWGFEDVDPALGLSDGECSVCGEPCSNGNWWFDDMPCRHHLGEEYDGVICEFVMSRATTREVSYVGRPAAEGTMILRGRNEDSDMGAPRKGKPDKAKATKPSKVRVKAEEKDDEEKDVWGAIESMQQIMADYDARISALEGKKDDDENEQDVAASAKASKNELALQMRLVASAIELAISEGRVLPAEREKLEAQGLKLAAGMGDEGMDAFEELLKGRSVPEEFGSDPVGNTADDAQKLSAKEHKLYQLKKWYDGGHITPAAYENKIKEVNAQYS